jgi:hypothetical protein
MKPPQEREEALFALALEKPVDKRAAFLDVMCEGDAPLRARLDALLAAHEQTPWMARFEPENRCRRGLPAWKTGRRFGVTKILKNPL